MYELFIANPKTEKRLRKYISSRKSIKNKLERLKQNPCKSIGAHPLQGKLKGKWACWLESNIRMIYCVDSKNKRIIIEAVGTHKIYQ